MKAIVAALLVITASACFSRGESAPLPRPRLVVIVSVDQLSASLFQEYRGQFTGGLKRLSEGIVFANGYQAHGVTVTCPGHASIASGSHPAHNGIVGNDWIDPALLRPDKRVYCAEDARAAGSSSSNYTVSDVALRVSTLGDWMKAANSRSRVVAVAGKDRSAVMLGGHAPDQRWWWRGDGFVQNGPASSTATAPVNAAIRASIARTRAALLPPPLCAARDRATRVAPGLEVGTFRFPRAAGDAKAFGDGPELDGATLAMAAALTQHLRLGRSDAPDLLAIGLSATDLIGHRYGTEGVEMCLQLLSLDRDLGDFLDFLDSNVADYVIVLTADHGGLDLPEGSAGVPGAARLDPAADVDAVSKAVAEKLGVTIPVFVKGWFFDSGFPAARRPQALALAQTLLKAHPQVDSVYTADEIAAHSLSKRPAEQWSVLDRLRASFDAHRSPPIAVVYKPYVTAISKPGPGYVATHGSVWDYDRKVPILFWWNGAPQEDRKESAMTVDIAPTLASLVGVTAPATIDGRCLHLFAEPADNCTTAKR